MICVHARAARGSFCLFHFAMYFGGGDGDGDDVKSMFELMCSSPVAANV